MNRKQYLDGNPSNEGIKTPFFEKSTLLQLSVAGINLSILAL